MPKFKATPTEYKGIVYRSKSEAMFARYLELRLDEDTYTSRQPTTPWFRENTWMSGCGGCCYEPQCLMVDGWTPVFLVFSVCSVGKFREDFLRENGNTGFPVVDYEIIEYKPSRPTATYAKAFDARIKKIFEKSIDRMAEYFASAKIYFGSPFTRDRGVYTDGCFCDGDGDDWLANYEESILETRFDLELNK